MNEKTFIVNEREHRMQSIKYKRAIWIWYNVQQIPSPQTFRNEKAHLLINEISPTKVSRFRIVVAMNKYITPCELLLLASIMIKLGFV